MFKVCLDGSGFTNLHYFSGLDGANPQASLVLSGNTLYGSTYAGGSGSNGTVFAVKTDGTAFTNLHSFLPLSPIAHLVPATNIDGARPNGLILAGNTLYGTASAGGAPGNGTLFALNTDGTCFTNLHVFSGGSGTLNLKNSDGINPEAGLILISNTLYGTTERGGVSGFGTLFALNTDGTGFTNLHSFSGTSSASANNDGAAPQAGLVASGNTLYGTTAGGGTWGHGTVFALPLAGNSPKLIYNFTGANGDGSAPLAGLAISGNTLYGTAAGILGVSFGIMPDEGFLGSPGSVFSFSLPVSPPQLDITLFGTNVMLAWSTNSPGFILQSAPTPNAAKWTSVVPEPVVINQLNRITNPSSGSQQFYRLIQSAP